MGEEAQPVPGGAVQPGVGDMLRIRREEYGLDLRDISNALNIRHPYLIAIEEGRLDSLPGATYAIGFVRAYADHLGLDGPAIVERYKDETAAMGDSAQLVFPSPLPEGKVPSGRILLFTMLALVAIYGGWVLLSSDQRPLAEIVPALPDRFRALIGMDEVAPSNANESAPMSTVASAVAEDQSESEPAVEAARDPAAEKLQTQDVPPPKTSIDEETVAAAPPPPETPAEMQEPADASSNATASEPQISAETTVSDRIPAVVAVTPKPPEVQVAPSAAPASAPPDPDPVTVADARPAEEGAEPDNTVAAPENPPVETNDAEGDAPKTNTMAEIAVTVLAPPAVPSEGTKEPRQYGAENTDARIVIRATDDSWVQVRDREGKLLLTRVLRVGDSYRVPNDTGAVMRTGNAGGLDIQVDGESVPGIGLKGVIRHEVALDAERLKAGTATRP